MKCVKEILVLIVTSGIISISCEVLSERRGKRNNGGALSKETTSQPTKPNPCDLFKPIMPNFNNGRRIAEAKCYEYVWELKSRDDKVKHTNACNEYYARQQIEETGTTAKTYFIIGGGFTLPGEFPHMGALGWRAVAGTWIFKCGSTLISPKFLLTAAHCSKVSSRDTSVANRTPEIVRLGDKNIIDNYANGRSPEDVRIKRIILHPRYQSPKMYYDIALIEMVKQVYFDSYIQPACLWTNPDTSPLGTRASVTGWGVVESAGKTTSPELKAAFVDLIDSYECNDFLTPAFNRHFKGVQPHQICAGVLRGGVDACQGDSGGPLQVKISLPITTQGVMSYVIGVTSFGVGCARANTPGVYTRVSSFIDWIESIVWK